MSKSNINTSDYDNENLNPSHGERETRFGALKVPEINDYTENEKKLKPILKFDDWGNEVGN